MPKRRNLDKMRKHTVLVGEDVRRATLVALHKFMASSANEYEFPSSLLCHERANVHTVAKMLGLRSKSRGTGLNRYITVYKREGSTIVQEDAGYSLSRNSRTIITNLLNKCPLSVKEKQDIMPLTERDRNHAPEGSLKDSSKQMGRLSSGVPLIPSSNNINQELLPHRQSLPIWPQRESIMQCINDNPVVIINGETGSGKTTQVPQLIMEYHSSISRACRIVCCEPRRISAVMTAERVSLERNAKLGAEVGYQIRHESRISPSTVLVYCTNGVLLRTLMGNDSGIATVTHLIIDEVHERDRFSDFLLITLRDIVSKYRSIKLILMSATLETPVFSKYFNNCPVLTVPGRLYEVQEYFLEDILKRTGYNTKEMIQMMQEYNKKNQQKIELEKWISSMANLRLSDVDKKKISVSNNFNKSSYHTSSNTPTPILGQLSDSSNETPVQEWVKKDMDTNLEKAWISSDTESEQAFKQLLVLIKSENVSVDYQNSDTGLSSLMVAAAVGNADVVEELLNLGASLNVKASNNRTALDFAVQMNQNNVIDLIKAYMPYYSSQQENCTLSRSGSNSGDGSDHQLSKEDYQLLDVYNHCFFNEEAINFDLILAIINEIQASNKKGSILVFLPGFDDIIALREKIKGRESKPKELRINIMTLYSKMSTGDQKRVFPPAPSGIRKVILSTNIAETSITIDDVVFVIDSGKIKERFYDSLSGVTMLKVMKISQACARQRRGRAGRTQPGVCYHLFSSVDYREMQKYQTPEILRTPLHELCLQTKLLAPPNTPIADFLAKAIDPPSFMVTRSAVQFLKTIDALDAWEDLTQLGHHLLDLPVDPHLGKMLLYSVVLKCVDPVLTIVSSLSYRDPFIIPDQPPMRCAVADVRYKFASKTFSDHMILLRVFQGWLAAREKGTSKSFCEQNFLSEPVLEMILSHRSQILQQMRSVGFVKNRGTHNQVQVSGDMKDLNSNSESWSLVKAALTGGLYPNLARADREAGHNAILRTQREFKVLLHPSSSLRETTRSGARQNHNTAVAALPSDWVLYEELGRTGNLCHIRMCTVVSPITVAIFAGPARLPADCLSDPETMDPGSDSEQEEISEGKTAILKLDDWVMFRVDPEAAKLALSLRFKWHALLMRRLRAPNKPSNQADDSVISSIVAVLNEEENSIGLQQPSGVGARPKQFSLENFISSEKSDCNSLKSYSSTSPSPTPSHGSTSDSQQNGAVASGNNGTGICGANGIVAARYFVIKASPKTMELNLATKSWPFTSSTEKKIVRAFKEGITVILVFGLQGSGHFQGYARLVSDKPDTTDSANSLDLAGTNFNPPLPIEWIKRGEIPYNCTRHLLNPYNDHNKVQTSRDGQEIEPNVGERLCHLWDKMPPPMPWVPKSVSIPPQNMFHQMPFGRPIRGHYQSNHNQHQYQPTNNSYSHLSPSFMNQHRKN